MITSISAFLNERVTVKRISSRSSDLKPVTEFLGSFSARIEDVTIVSTSTSGALIRYPSKKVFLAETNNVIKPGDIVILPDGEQREVTTVKNGVPYGSETLIEVIL